MQPLNHPLLRPLLKKLILMLCLAAPLDTPIASETIYRWTGKGGIPCFSNIAPYGDRVDVEAQEGVKSNQQNMRQILNKDDGLKKKAIHQERVKTNLIKNSGRSLIQGGENRQITEKIKFIGQRIKKNKTSIQAIETMLKLKPGNQRLRKSIRLKQKQVQKDRHVLESLEEF